jgi:uncharacterized membrane protein
MVEPSLPLTVTYGVLGAVSVSLGKGFQKYGVAVVTHPREMLRRKNLFKLLVWLLGTAGIVSSAFFIFAACAYGPVTIVGALSGTGLVALVLFSVFALKEPFGAAEAVGIAAILIGTALAGYFEGWSGITGHRLPNPSGLRIAVTHVVGMGLAATALAAAAAVYSWRSGNRYFGIIFGSISGFCGGLSVFFQKGAMLTCGCSDLFADIPAALRNPFFYLFAVTGILDFVVTQYALTRSKAVTVVPCYQSFYMAIPILGGIVGYYDGINAAQLLGIAFLLAGVIVLSLFIGRGETAAEEPAADPA